MKRLLVKWGVACLVSVAMAGCGGGSSGQSGSAPQGSGGAVNGVIVTASALAANDTASNASAPFTVVQGAGVAAVIVNGPPKVNFTVFSDGKVKTDLAITNVSFAIAKLVPGTSGNPDQWVNYIYRKETATAGVGPGGAVTPPATTMQATTDLKQTDPALLAAQLVYNPDGYYTYTFRADIKDPKWAATVNKVPYSTNNVVFEPALTHRVAIQLSYKNAKGETVLVNPYFDFTIGADGKSVPVTDPAKTRKMTDVASCNNCHGKLALHGGGRVDTQFCVMCHNPGTTDANSGNVLNFATMVHKLHAGKLLKSKSTAIGGEDYTIWGFGDSKHSYAEVGFPQDLRNCAVCHSGANPKTPQGDNWKTTPTQEACLTCHVSGTGSTWETLHKVVAGVRVGPGAPAKALTNADCADCHKVGSVISPERVHFNQAQSNAALYKMNIEGATFNDTADHKARSVTVKYFLSDPTNGNAAYNLVTSDCTYTGTAGVCVPPTTTPATPNNTKFGNLRFYLAYQNMVGQPDAVTEFSAYNNGGNSANAYAHTGVNDGSNHYTVSIPVPDDTATAVAKGTARVVSIGQIVEHKLSPTASTDPRPEVIPTVLVNTVAQHTYKELALTGSLLPRRTIVSTEKCNVCHGTLGSASGSNTLPNAFHSGGRTIVEACVTCHDPNRMSSTVMTNGSTLNESFQFKRMIHGIHGNSKRIFPFTHDNKVVGTFCNPANTSAIAKAACDGTLTFATGVVNYAAEVAYPDATLNCNACHVNNSYKTDMGTLGAVVHKDAGVTDPNLWKVISPKAATCTSCHDSAAAITHVTSFGGAVFGDKTQAELAGLPRESCDDCHASGGVKDVNVVHGLK
ncbi:OmcA/MtrC family decaheme c-type cytochrome [Rhodoferax sp. UBA5149]|uniref:OmcA/MtrC family decaheme c-type cytochrome n=1 Tax=Rhodoferax sp. UBA5149 TaxID=1947379 RepID=UPI0025F23D86|nr:OmcA/MtrC family decaheme c-type cytochrome [Rhodoferax sp. UBA5149]